MPDEKKVTCFYYCDTCDKPIDPDYVDTIPVCPDCMTVATVEGG